MVLIIAQIAKNKDLIYKQTEQSFYTQNKATHFYRFQENLLSYPCLKLDQKDDVWISKNGYVYFSVYKQHHLYFLRKRMRQMMHQRCMQNIGIPFTHHNILEDKTYDEILNFIRQEEFHAELYCLSIPSFFCQLLKENMITNLSEKKGNRLPERVDRNIFGGGIGLTDEWLSLLENLYLFSSKKTLKTKDFVSYLKKLRFSICQKKEFSYPFVEENRLWKMNSSFNSSFTKYELMNLFEQIVLKEKCLKNSSLALDPKETISSYIQNYENTKQILLQSCEKQRQKNDEYLYKI